MEFRRVNLLLTALLAAFTIGAQPVNDACGSALPLCPNIPLSATNQGATATTCPFCEDDFTFCFSGTNTVWFSFNTNATGGMVNIDFSNLNFVVQANRGTQLQATIFSATVPCDGGTYTALGNCVATATGNFTLTANSLTALTTYYVVVNGATNGGAVLPAEASFDLVASGPGIDRLPAGIAILMPGGTLCPNNPTTILAPLDNCTDTTDFTWYLNGVVAAVTSENMWQTSELQDGDSISVECSCFTDCPQEMVAWYSPVSVEDLFVNAGPDQSIEPGESVVLSGSSNGITYSWTPSNSVASPDQLQTVAIPPSTTTYFLTASSANCTLSDDVTITVTDQFTIPGSFSPNGDGTNDKWIIKGIDEYPNALVQIFDRWGQEMLNVSGYSSQKSWDGTHNGKEVTDGVYFYIIDLRDKAYPDPFKGNITIIR
jgi:gliding motility-associated-like protein